MDKFDLGKQFSSRLRDAMLAAGYNSNRSTSGVCIHKLAELTGYSLQICRKYLKGQAIPEPAKLVDIARKLQVSPGWLLFGDSPHVTQSCENRISIHREILHYIFCQAAYLYQDYGMENNVPAFLMDLINDISLINGNEEQTKKIIDLSISSVKHFAG
ncbi:helix-turn-helix domain-containing protein [Legionella waltersii]|uniref:Putative transcriptional regulator n=1 Tax=Legionella waltersii TaxID=66969 RepID=A0A0W1ADE7_9GAMM|nr:helix-turn-helix transcriptional regulator [Legionella waltersii]KTD79320.1 putative transcriptional regulator [Legionella waltersii]SNV13048.1 putative transcriptional regulator [Legionella waltersii]